MQLLRHFTIRRVVLWIMIISFTIVMLTSVYGSLMLHNMNQHVERSGALAKQLAFIAKAEMVRDDANQAELTALQTEVPAGNDWNNYRAAVIAPESAYKDVAHERLTALQEQVATENLDVGSDSNHLDFVYLSGLLAAGILLIFCDRYLVVHLVRPVGKIRAHFRVIASGDLTLEPEDLGRNCVGQLVPLVKEMQHSLLDTVLAIRDNATLLHQEAGEIAAGNADLSDRTATQAAALEQTAASMEELTATVSHNAGNARDARELAEQTTSSTQKGEQLVKTVATAMNGIAEGSEKIRQFTSTINSIAFQTNILALNAAVEAARAGEQGRGFAVVASEVRSLAQRSAAAAKEIEQLISDTVSRVDHGRDAADSAGAIMDDVLRGVGGVNELIGQIAMASEEQSKGISMVTLAVAELDRVTQQNATLVQQVSVTAGSLNGQTESLTDAIRRFTLPDSNLLPHKPGVAL